MPSSHGSTSRIARAADTRFGVMIALNYLKKPCQSACKPGSVRDCSRDDYSSGTIVTNRLKQPTRAASVKTRLLACARNTAPIWSCSRWGLPCRFCCQKRGALLPHPFTLTLVSSANRCDRAVCFLWHFPWGHPRRTLSGTLYPWSPDFPLRAKAHSSHPAD